MIKAQGRAYGFAMGSVLAGSGPASRAASPRAAEAAEVFVQAWVNGVRLTPKTFPEAPTSVAELYETHRAIAEHPLVASRLGGHAGYKLGAIGGAGEPCIYAPLLAKLFI